MSFSQEAGYIPAPLEAIIDEIREGINERFGTNYQAENFVGTNWYKYSYAVAQRLQRSEIKTSEVFSKLQDYINLTNLRIQRPVATNQGLIEAFERKGYVASVKKAIVEDAGLVHVCVDVDETADDYAEKKLEICTVLKDSVALSMVTVGTEEEAIVLTNGQSFDWKYSLPNRIPTLLRLTITTSVNNQFFIQSPEWVKDRLLDNIRRMYRLGKNFEPQTYFTVVDAPWAGIIELAYSINDGADWLTTVYEADYDDLLTFSLADTTLIEA